ncbi:ABC transporter substrate-binding protein [Paracoccus yeei]|uniref:ABC transporter substrate-binding protein n=1 Tax=Paracoccus yeei TaxID=147645 RepID=UPI000EA1E6D4|nr:ABC transporter substrate-binding protein [Paracoccus yeei]
MKRRNLLLGMALAVSTALAGLPALAQAEPFKVGLILPMTGPFASTGRQIEAAAKLYIARHGDEVAGRKVELLVKDDARENLIVDDAPLCRRWADSTCPLQSRIPVNYL